MFAADRQELEILQKFETLLHLFRRFEKRHRIALLGLVFSVILFMGIRLIVTSAWLLLSVR